MAKEKLPKAYATNGFIARYYTIELIKNILHQGILRDKAMFDKLMYINNYFFCTLIVLAEKFGRC